MIQFAASEPCPCLLIGQFFLGISAARQGCISAPSFTKRQLHNGNGKAQNGTDPLKIWATLARIKGRAAELGPDQQNLYISHIRACPTCHQQIAR